MAATGTEGSGKREADGDSEKGLQGIRDGFELYIPLEWMCVGPTLLFEVVLLIQIVCGSLSICMFHSFFQAQIFPSRSINYDRRVQAQLN